jgi:hypothetical protein
MPELAELTRAMNDDLNGVRWAQAPQIRGRGQQRQRRGRLLAAAIVAVALVGIGAVGLAQPSTSTQHPAGPGSASPVDSANLPLDTSAVEWSVMIGARLAPRDIAADAVQRTGSSGESALGACRPATSSAPQDMPLAVEDILGSVLSWDTTPAGGQVDEQITWYRPGSALAGIRYDLEDLLAGQCKATYSLVASGFVGEESRMIAVQAPSMPPRVEVFVAARDFLIWLRVAGPFDNLHDYARQLAQRAVAKLDCSITGQSTC